MTNSAEGDLEATIWAAMTRYKVTTDHPIEFLQMVTDAALDYAAGDSDALTAARRRVLFEATAPEQPALTVIAGGGGQPARRELDPSGSRAVAPEGATLSTGQSVPTGGKDRANLHPQAVDNR